MFEPLLPRIYVLFLRTTLRWERAQEKGLRKAIQKGLHIEDPNMSSEETDSSSAVSSTRETALTPRTRYLQEVL